MVAGRAVGYRLTAVKVAAHQHKLDSRVSKAESRQPRAGSRKLVLKN